MRLILPYIALISHLFWSSPPSYQAFEVLESSRIEIKGTSNVNEFSCDCNIQEVDKRFVRYEAGKSVQKYAVMRFPVKGFDCGGKMINRDFMELIKAKEHPNLNLKLLGIEPVSSTRAKVNIEVEIAGKKNRYSTWVNYRRGNSNNLETSGKFSLNIEDFDIEQPKKLMGLIVIDKKIDILFKLHFKPIH